ncbi:unnamed protein product [Ixodes pacificus]
MNTVCRSQNKSFENKTLLLNVKKRFYIKISQKANTIEFVRLPRSSFFVLSSPQTKHFLAVKSVLKDTLKITLGIHNMHSFYVDRQTLVSFPRENVRSLAFYYYYYYYYSTAKVLSS